MNLFFLSNGDGCQKEDALVLHSCIITLWALCLLTLGFLVILSSCKSDYSTKGDVELNQPTLYRIQSGSQFVYCPYFRKFGHGVFYPIRLLSSIEV